MRLCTPSVDAQTPFSPTHACWLSNAIRAADIGLQSLQAMSSLTIHAPQCCVPVSAVRADLPSTCRIKKKCHICKVLKRTLWHISVSVVAVSSRNGTKRKTPFYKWTNQCNQMFLGFPCNTFKDFFPFVSCPHHVVDLPCFCTTVQVCSYTFTELIHFFFWGENWHFCKYHLELFSI